MPLGAFKCRGCFARFATESERADHEQVHAKIHEAMKPIISGNGVVCRFCGLTFTGPYQLSLHFEAKHLSECQ